MADGTVRGELSLTSEQALHGLREIRDTGREADQALESLGRRMDELGRRTARPRVDLTGLDEANRKLTELEMRLDRLSARRFTPSVGIAGSMTPFGGGGGMSSSQGLVAGGAGSPLFSSVGGMAGRLPWWAMAAPVIPQLLGGAGALAGSAGSAALGAGTIGLGGLASVGVGAGFTMAIARPAITALQEVTKAQTAYTDAVDKFGGKSTQAAAAQRNLNAALAANPAAAGVSRQLGAFTQGFQTATQPGRQAFYSGLSGALYNARVATPTLAIGANSSASATGAAASSFSGFLAQPEEQAMLLRLSGSFAQNLPIAERSLANITTTFGHLAVDAIPFFTQANLWVERWTTGLAQQSADQPRVQSAMQRMVDSAKQWGQLTEAGYHVIRDLFSQAAPSGGGMVQDLTHTLDRWDQWIRNNPDKVQRFFQDSAQGTERIATILGNLTRDLAQIFGYLDPILKRGEQFLSFASSIGGGSLLTGGLLLYSGYRGAQAALGGGGPSPGGALSSFIFGSPAAAARSSAGGRAAVAGGAGLPAAEDAATARYLMAPTGFQAAGPAVAESQLPLFGAGAAGYVMRGAAIAPAARGAGAFEQAYGSYAPESRFAMPVSSIEAEAGMLSKAGTAIRGAARVAVPVMAALSAIEGVSAGANAGGSPLHGINVGLSSALSTLTLGLAKPTTLQQLFGGAPTGASLRNPRTRTSLDQLTQQANAVQTPAQLAAVQSKVSGSTIQLELPPGEQRRYQTYLQNVLSTAAKNAGAYASNSWEQSFALGIQRGVGPEDAVKQMLKGMMSQVTQLGPRGSLAFARDTAQWVSQMEAADPKMIKPLEKLMHGIVDDINQMNHTVGTTFKDLQNKVFYFNGQILQGSQTTWQQISSALVDPSKVAQEKLSGIWATIQQEAIDALTGMGFTKEVAQGIVTQTAKGGTPAAFAGALVNVATGGLPTINKPGGPIVQRARGGVIQGQGLLDTVPTPDGGLAAPGEVWIANRHTMNDLSSATIEKYGKTAWQMIRDEDRPHSLPLKRYMIGGQFSAGQAVGSTPQGTQGWVARQHPELHGGIAQAVEDVLSHFPLNITSTTGGGHVPGSYHYKGEAADIAGNSSLMFSAAEWIKSSGLASGLTEGIHNPNLAVKYGQIETPPGVFGGVWAGHANHIHMAVAGALAAGAAAGGGGARGFMPSAISLKPPRIGLGGIPGALGDQASRMYAAGLSQRLNSVLGAAGGAGAISAAGFSGGGNAQANQQLGQRMMLSAGWGMDQWPALQALWTQESGWNSNSVNSSSGAYGIPQALGHGHPFNLGDAPAQIAWGLNYIRGRYGSPAAAEAHERAHNWYSRGGRVNWAGWNARGGSFVTNGPTMFGAGEFGNKERVSITPVGGGDGRVIHVNMEHVHLGGGSPEELEAVARDVAERIHDALDRVSGDATDSDLVGA